jgi:hypothetical protein
MFRSRRKFQRNLHDNHYRSVVVDGLKVFYREARKVDAHLSRFYCTDYSRPRANEASTANQSSRHGRQGCGLAAADER